MNFWNYPNAKYINTKYRKFETQKRPKTENKIYRKNKIQKIPIFHLSLRSAVIFCMSACFFSWSMDVFFPSVKFFIPEGWRLLVKKVLPSTARIKSFLFCFVFSKNFVFYSVNPQTSRSRNNKPPWTFISAEAVYVFSGGQVTGIRWNMTCDRWHMTGDR